MKFVLLNPNDPIGYKIEREPAGNMGVCYKDNDKHYFFPITLTYAISALLDTKKGFKVIDGQAMDYSDKEIISAVEKEQPNYILALVSLPSIDHDIKLLEKIKLIVSQCKICVFGGPCNVIPEYILKNKWIDYALQGRFPYYNHIFEFCNSPSKKCHGLVYIDNGKLICNKWNIENDLDKLNFKSFGYINIKRYVQTTKLTDKKKISYAAVLTAVGCHYNCSYCPYPLTYGNKVIYKSINKVMKEIEFLVKLGIKGFYVRNIVLENDKKWFKQLCKKIIDKKLNIEWVFEARVDQMDEEILSLMKKAGCVKIDFGVETGSQKLLKSIGKPGLNVDRIRKVFDYCNKIGIFPMAQLILGLPGETKQTIKETKKLIRQINPVNVNFNICTPYPGTRVYEIAKKKGLIEDFNYAHYTSHTEVMRTEQLSRSYLKMIERKMKIMLRLKQFINNKNQRIMILKKIHKKIFN